MLRPYGCFSVQSQRTIIPLFIGLDSQEIQVLIVIVYLKRPFVFLALNNLPALNIIDLFSIPLLNFQMQIIRVEALEI